MTFQALPDERVRCRSCIARFGRQVERDGGPDGPVGNAARPDMGHQMYFTRHGRVALCALRVADEHA